MSPRDGSGERERRRSIVTRHKIDDFSIILYNMKNLHLYFDSKYIIIYNYVYIFDIFFSIFSNIQKIMQCIDVQIYVLKHSYSNIFYLYILYWTFVYF